MSTPLVVLAAILAFFALILIPLMMMKADPQDKLDQPRDQGSHVKKAKRKKKR